MSPTVNNFVHDLVAMAKAMEDLPQVQAQLDHVRADNDRLASTVMRREETILELKAEVETLQSTIRKTEAERDDAEIRFLELDEKASGALRMVKTAMDQLDQVVVKIEPPKPMPEPEVQETTGTMPAPAEGQSEPLPPVHTASTSDTPSDASSPPAIPEVADSTGEVGSGANPEVTKSEADPTVSAWSTGKYSGMRYSQVPYYVPFSLWLDGGGTNADYHR